jgi:hypothetical protein
MFRRPLPVQPRQMGEREQAAEVAIFATSFWCGTGWPEGYLPRASCKPQMAKYRCLSPQVKREPQHLVYSMRIPPFERQSLYLR